MKKVVTIWLMLMLLFAVTIAAVWITQPLPPSSMGQIVFPFAISDDAWLKSIKKDPTAHGCSGYPILGYRGSEIAIETALKDIQHPKLTVWINAASYLGRFDRKEAVPYLIKALRRTTSYGNDERVRMLQRITGQNIGNDFSKWQEWYLSTPDPITLDWKGNLGYIPREKKGSQQSPSGDAEKGSPEE